MPITIIDETKPKLPQITLDRLSCNEAFKFVKEIEASHYLKTSVDIVGRPGHHWCPVLDFSDGRVKYFDSDSIVYRINATITFTLPAKEPQS